MMPRGIFSSPKTSTQSWRPLATCAAPRASAAPPLAQPASTFTIGTPQRPCLGGARAHAQAAREFDGPEAVGHLAPVAGWPRLHRGVEAEPGLGSDAHLEAAVGGAVWTHRPRREVRLTARGAARGKEARPVRVGYEQAVDDGARIRHGRLSITTPAHHTRVRAWLRPQPRNGFPQRSRHATSSTGFRRVAPKRSTG